MVDNESTDNSISIIQSIKKENQDLIVSTAPNIYKHSWTEPVEEGLSLSNGEYFTILGADDYISEDYIEKIIKILNKSNGKIELLQRLFKECPVNTPTVVYKKKLHSAGIVFWDSQEYLGAADYNLYFNLADKNKFIYPYPKWVGYYYRWHSEQSTWGMHKEETKFDEKIKDHWRKKWQN